MKQELTKFELAAIGAVALSYNELSATLDTLLTVLAGAQSYAKDLNSKIDIITSRVAQLYLELQDKKQITDAVEAFRRFAIYHDLIKHVRIMQLIGKLEPRPRPSSTRGASPFSDKALNIFYDHIIALEKELFSAATLICCTSKLKSASLDDPKISVYAEGTRACCFQFRGYGTRRRALTPIPWLPSEQELQDVKTKWQEAQQVEMMAWLTAWPDSASLIGAGEAS
jgi:hypothetical protein